MVVTVIRDSHERRKTEGKLEFCNSNFVKFSKRMNFFVINKKTKLITRNTTKNVPLRLERRVEIRVAQSKRISAGVHPEPAPPRGLPADLVVRACSRITESHRPGPGSSM